MKALSFLIIAIFGSLAYVAIMGLITAMQHFDKITGYMP